jgi:hypothetical protein
MKTKTYHTVGTVPNSIIKVVKRGKIGSPNATFTFLGWHRYVNDKWRDNASLMNIMPTFTYNWENSVIIKNDIILNIMYNRINLRS